MSQRGGRREQDDGGKNHIVPLVAGGDDIGASDHQHAHEERKINEPYRHRRHRLPDGQDQTPGQPQ